LLKKRRMEDMLPRRLTSVDATCGESLVKLWFSRKRDQMKIANVLLDFLNKRK
jgi:hypothetical protein